VRPTMAVSVTPATVTKPRGVIVQLLDKLTETRLRRDVQDMERNVTYTEHDVTPHRTRGS
jgi:hypothetical protein